MSTRATYKFENVTYYIHYDGYPEGAASYFQNALLGSNGRGGLESRFLRYNELAEVTESHEIHGDTEFRYTVKKIDNQNILCAQEYFDGKWEVIFSGTVYEFINKYIHENNKPENQWKPCIVNTYSTQWANKEKAELLLAEEESRLVDFIKDARVSLDNPNIAALQGNIKNLRQFIKSF